MSTPTGRSRIPGVLRRLRPLLSWLISLVSLLVILAVLRGAGVPLSFPGVLVVMLFLFTARAVIGWRRRRRRRLRSPSRSR